MAIRPTRTVAATKVFGKFDLLQQILLHLPLRQLLLAQRISRIAFQVVQSSTEIRQALFFLPTANVVHTEDESWIEDGKDEEKLVVFNPFLDV